MQRGDVRIFEAIPRIVTGFNTGAKLAYQASLFKFGQPFEDVTAFNLVDRNAVQLHHIKLLDLQPLTRCFDGSLQPIPAVAIRIQLWCSACLGDNDPVSFRMRFVELANNAFTVASAIHIRGIPKSDAVVAGGL